jgi:hypothetical protein
LGDLKEARRYWKLKEEVQDHTLWKAQFGRGCGPVARQKLDLMFSAHAYMIPEILVLYFRFIMEFLRTVFHCQGTLY